MALCRQCNVSESSESYLSAFCSSKCLEKYYNSLRLFFPTNLSPASDERDSTILNSRIALTSLIANRTLEENMLLCEILTEAVISLNVILIPQKAHKEIKEKVAADLKRKADNKARIEERDRGLVESAEVTRQKQEILKSGDKLSKTGLCHYCGAPSQAMFCKGTDHKLKYTVVENYAKRMNVSLERARKLVDAMTASEEKEGE